MVLMAYMHMDIISQKYTYELLSWFGYCDQHRTGWLADVLGYNYFDFKHFLGYGYLVLFLWLLASIPCLM